MIRLKGNAGTGNVMNAVRHARAVFSEIRKLQTMRDDETGEALIKRADDTEEALATRLSAYHAQSAPVLAHYQPTGCVARVDGDQTQERVWEAIEDALAA